MLLRSGRADGGVLLCDFARSHDGVGVDADRVFHTARVTTGEGCGHGNAVAASREEDTFVTGLEARLAESQPAKLIFY